MSAWRESGLYFVIRRRHWRVAIGEAHGAVALVGVELEADHAVGGNLQGVLQRDDRAADGGIRAALESDAIAEDVAGDAAEAAGEVDVETGSDDEGAGQVGLDAG